MTASLCFNDVSLSPVIIDNQPWFSSSEIARALGYAREDTISRLYDRNADEFTENMTQVIENVDTVNLTVTGNLINKVRIFSLRGCHLLAMFARTPVAKSFRHWVLDVIEQYGEQVQPEQISPSLTPSTPSDRKSLRALVNAWAGIANVQHNLLWLQILAHFQIDRINDLPVEWIPRAIAWVQERIDTISVPRTLPEQKPLPAAPALPASPCFDEHDIQSFAEELRHWHQEVRRRILTLTGRYQQCGMPVLMEAMRRIEGGTFKKSVQISSFNRMLFDQGFFMIEAIPGCRNETLPDSNNPAMYLIDFARALNAK